jgi:Tfp pilus assembly protein PilO
MNISFKRPEDMVPSVMILLSIVILAATLAFMLLSPVPTVASVQKSHRLARIKLVNQVADLNRAADNAEKEAKTRVWPGDAESVSTAILGNLTTQANRLSLKVAAFRPQRTVLLDGLTELPFSVQVSGPYAKVRKVIASFDTATSKVAVESAQIASSSQSTSNDVTATLTLAAYLPNQPAPVATPPARTVTVTVTGGPHGSR